MKELEKNLLEKIKFMNLKKERIKGFIVHDDKAIFYSSDIMLKFQIDDNFKNDA